MSSTRDKILRETAPLSIFFVKSGSGGNRLLFRYPYDETFHYDPELALYNNIGDLLLPDQERRQFQDVINESDEALCNMFSVNPNLCGQKFEIKISRVRHVGHPMSLLTTSALAGQTNGSDQQQSPTNHHHTRTPVQRVNLDLSSYDCLTAPNRNLAPNQGDITSFNIVCALRSSASYDIVDCYHDLSKRLAVGLSFEERRDSYLSNEIKTILSALEENDIAKLTNSDDANHQPNSADSNHRGPKMNGFYPNQQQHFNDGQFYGNSQQQQQLYQKQINGSHSSESIYSTILARSNLARDLKRVFICLATSGIVDLKINNFVRVSFCLPQRVHRLKLMTHKSMPAIGNEDIKKCLIALRPYHGLLLLQDQQELLNSLPIDASPAFIQLIRVTKPDKNFMELSVDANLTLMQIFHIVSQLIYWAKATVIYPICDSNIYAIHPLASTGLSTKVVSDFRTRFPNNKPLHHYLAEFSEGISLSQLNGPLLSLEEKSNLLSIVTWLLQRRILTQIHKYTFLMVDKEIAVLDKSSQVSNRQLSAKQQQQQVTDQSINNNELSTSSPQNIVMNNSTQNSSSSNNNNNNNGSNNGRQLRAGGVTTTPAANNGPLRIPSIPSNSFESSPRMMKNSLTESFDSSVKRYRADSLAESTQEVDSNFGLNSSLSSTPNSNLDYYISPGNDMSLRLSFSSSCPLDGGGSGGGVGGGENSITLTNGMGVGETIVSALQRAGLSMVGIKHLLSIPSSRNLDDLRLLIRLMPYLNGKHHIEDIMFLENLERSQVLILCDKFRDILFTCHYEDVAVSQLCPFTSVR